MDVRVRGLAGLLLLVLGCGETPIGRKAPGFSGAMDMAVLDTLAVPEGFAIEVSVNGVIAQREDPFHLLLRDATGGVHVVLPESTRLLVGARLMVQGLLRRPDGEALVEAEEWLYDSTAAPVRSP